MGYTMYAPEIIEQIPDIKQMYDINDTQADEIDEAFDTVNNDFFYQTMGVELIEVYEKLLGITRAESDTLDERRSRIITQIFNSTPYTLKDIEARFKVLAPDGFNIVIDYNNLKFTCYIALKNQKYLNYTNKMLDQMLPVAFAIETILKYNTWDMISTYTCDELKTYTYKQLREEVFE